MAKHATRAGARVRTLFGCCSLRFFFFCGSRGWRKRVNSGRKGVKISRRTKKQSCRDNEIFTVLMLGRRWQQRDGADNGYGCAYGSVDYGCDEMDDVDGVC